MGHNYYIHLHTPRIRVNMGLIWLIATCDLLSHLKQSLKSASYDLMSLNDPKSSCGTSEPEMPLSRILQLSKVKQFRRFPG